MKRIMDTVEIHCRFFEGKEQVASFALSHKYLHMHYECDGEQRTINIPRWYAMQVVKAIAEQIERRASEVMRESEACDYDCVGSYAHAERIRSPITEALACPNDPGDWPVDDEEIVGADIGGGWSSIVRRWFMGASDE